MALTHTESLLGIDASERKEVTELLKFLNSVKNVTSGCYNYIRHLVLKTISKHMARIVYLTYLTVELRLRFQVSPRRTYGGQFGTVT
jgi:hypothetical protein